jgi:TonB dependent receptor/Carboxypeptidase regulatory-like domain
MRRLFLLLSLLIALAAPHAASATIFGSVRGIVHDPQHRPIPNAQVTLKADDSDYSQTKQSNNDGEFEFDAVPIGNYTVTVTRQDFSQQQQTVLVRSDTSPVLHFELSVAGTTQTTVVSGAPIEASVQSVTPTTTISRIDVQNTPGADRTNSMAVITDYVPGAYMVHDMLHVRGGHQYSWLIDGVPVPNTNIATNVGPQFDPKDADYIETQRGSYDADYGDRTYGVFNVVPRTGFERDRECDLVVSAGDFYQTNDQISCGGHSQRLAYYASINGNRSDLGLMTPSATIAHDMENGYGGFGSLIFNAGPSDQLRLVTSIRRDYFQMPVDPEDVANGVIQVDGQHETDAFVNFSWVHTFSHQGLLTVSPYYHFNSANYDSAPFDFPNAITDDHASNYVGAQATISGNFAHNSLDGGVNIFYEHDNQLFGVLFNDGANAPLQDREIVSGNVEAVFVDDRFEVTPWLSFSGGVRETHFSSSSNESETATSPRLGVAIRIPKINWVLRGFYGQFYQPPPLASVTGPLLTIVNTPGSGANPQQFIPIPGERDTEFQVGINMPYKGWSLDMDTFRTRAHNFLDHGNINYVFDGNVVTTNIFLPLSTQNALVEGWEVTLRSPRLWHRGQLHLAYSNQVANFSGCITGGLTDFECQIGWAPLDHDQRNTLNLGFDVTLPWAMFVSGNYYYGSGFTNGDPPPDYLPAHSTLDLSVGKSFGEKYSISVSALNVANSHLLIDNSFTFGGVHWNNPRELFAEFRYRFHY